MHLESAVPQKGRRPLAEGAAEERVAPAPRARPPRLGEVGRRQTLNVFSAEGKDVSAEVGSEEAQVDETAFLKQPTVIFTRGKKGLHYTLLLLDYHKQEGRAPHHRLHWLVTDIPGEDFADGNVSGGSVLADFEAPCAPVPDQPRLYVLMVFEQREDLAGGQPLACHPDLCAAALRRRHGFPLTTWLRCNGPKMARIAACQQFRAYCSDDTLHVGVGDQSPAERTSRVDQLDGELGDAEESDSGPEENKENQLKKQRKSKHGKIGRLRRFLLPKKKHRIPI